MAKSFRGKRKEMKSLYAPPDHPTKRLKKQSNPIKVLHINIGKRLCAHMRACNIQRSDHTYARYSYNFSQIIYIMEEVNRIDERKRKR